MCFFDYVLQSINTIEEIKGIGPQTLKALKKANINTIWALLTHFPKKITELTNLTLPQEDGYCVVKATLLSCIRQSGKIRFLINFKDESGKMGKIIILTPKLPLAFQPNKTVIIQGKQEKHTFIHPKFISTDLKILHQYFLPAPLFDSTIQKLITHLLQNKSFEEKAYHEHTWKKLFHNLHFGNPQEHGQTLNILKTLEALAYHYIWAKEDSSNKTQPMHKISDEYQFIYDKLFKTLTTCQLKAVEYIKQDFSKEKASKRMIFGDVGTGKTRVTIMSALYALSAKKKVVFLAPTNLLAEQVYKVFTSTLPNTKISLYTQKSKKNTNADIIIGTHAIFQEKVQIDNIGLIIIDEQHKFGVKQRLALTQKDTMNQAHLLSLSATPIPRSLAMVMQNYIPVSILRHKPKPVDISTYLLSNSHIDDFLHKLQNNLQNDEFCYWICPAVSDEEDELNYMNAENRFQELQNIFHDKVGLLHGKMKKDQQSEIYQQILDHKIQILVATTVVEVGIDIPHANLIIIEDANRFGLAQLHQLRGRVGRNGQPGKCILFYPKHTSEVGKQRLQAMKEFSDGFTLAEKDMEIRGYGNVFGTQQTGYYDFQFLEMPLDTTFLNETKQEKYENIEKLASLFFLLQATETI